MENRIGFLEEKPGCKSATRLVFLTGSFWTMALVSYLAVRGSSAADLVVIFTSIMSVLAGTKLIQKGQENKN